MSKGKGTIRRVVIGRQMVKKKLNVVVRIKNSERGSHGLPVLKRENEWSCPSEGSQLELIKATTNLEQGEFCTCRTSVLAWRIQPSPRQPKQTKQQNHSFLKSTPPQPNLSLGKSFSSLACGV